jgi:hypothetical protein
LTSSNTLAIRACNGSTTPVSSLMPQPYGQNLG